MMIGSLGLGLGEAGAQQDAGGLAQATLALNRYELHAEVGATYTYQASVAYYDAAAFEVVEYPLVTKRLGLRKGERAHADQALSLAEVDLDFTGSIAAREASRLQRSVATTVAGLAIDARTSAPMMVITVTEESGWGLGCKTPNRCVPQRFVIPAGAVVENGGRLLDFTGKPDTDYVYELALGFFDANSFTIQWRELPFTRSAGARTNPGGFYRFEIGAEANNQLAAQLGQIDEERARLEEEGVAPTVDCGDHGTTAATPWHLRLTFRVIGDEFPSSGVDAGIMTRRYEPVYRVFALARLNTPIGFSVSHPSCAFERGYQVRSTPTVHWALFPSTESH
jgi:hypothetical protein